MSHNVLVNRDHIHVGGTAHKSGDVVKVSDDEFTALTAANRFSDGTLTDQGAVANSGDAVYTKATAPSALAAMTSNPAATSPPTKAEYDALRQDQVNLRTYVAALVTAMTGTGKEF